jgi:serine/threonine protein kinase
METSKYINHKYEILEAIGNGNFGNVFKGIHRKNREPVAIKMESKSSPFKILKNETTILNYLYNEGCRSIPKVIWYGLYSDKTCLIMDIFECSLYDYLKTKSLPEEKVNKIIHQSIYIIETIHSKFVLHRDIKPHNFMIRNGELYLIDFGFSTFYVNAEKEHYPMRTDLESIIGSPKYVSINLHNGITCSRRDDLISIGYMYIYLLYGELPWDKKLLLVGSFQSEKYFIDYKKEIINLFQISDELKQKVIEYLNKIGINPNRKLTSIHIRRGDYLKFSKFHVSMNFFLS